MRNALRPMGRFFCLLKWLAAGVAMAATTAAQTNGPTMTQVVDTVYRADGTVARGTVLISWPAFTTLDGKAVAAGSVSVQLGNGGAFAASLAPNTGAQPAGVSYKVIYQLASQEPSTEYWVVPSTGSTTIGAVRAKLQPQTIAAQVLTRDVADTNYVHVAGDQMIGGVKKFAALASSSIQGIQYVCLQNGADIGAKLQSAYSNLPTDSGGHKVGTMSFDGCTGYYSWITPITMTGARVKITANSSSSKIQLQCNIVNCLTLNVPPNALSSDGDNMSIFSGWELDGNSSIPGQCGITVADVYNVALRDLKFYGFSGVGSSPICIRSNTVNSTGVEGLKLADVFLVDNFYGLNFANQINSANGASFGYGDWTGVRWFTNVSGGAFVNLPSGNLHNSTIHVNANVNTSSATVFRVSGKQYSGGPGTALWLDKLFVVGECTSGCNGTATTFDLGTGTAATVWLDWHDSANLNLATGAGILTQLAEGAYDHQTTTYAGHKPFCSGTSDPNLTSIGGNYQACMLPYGSSSYVQGFSWNMMYDRANQQYSCPGDGTANGCSAALANNAGNINFVAVPFNGGATQNIPDTNILKRTVMRLDTLGSHFFDGVTQTEVAKIDTGGNATVQNLTVNGICAGCGGGSGGDLASPPAIGNGTPNTGSFTTLKADDLVSKNYPVIDARAWGAVGDGKFIPDNCSTTAGSNVVTCTGSAANPPLVATGPPFVSSDVGKTFWMPGAGNVGPNSYLVTTIATYISPSQVRFSVNALNTVARSSATFGHDNYATFCAISNCTSATVPNNWYAWPRNGKQIHVPAGMYLTSHPLYVRNGDMWWGDGETASDIRLMNAANDIFVVCADGNASGGQDTCAGDQFNAGASQTFTVKGLFLTNSTMNDDIVHGPVGVYVPPDAAAYKIIDNWFDTSSGGIFVNRGNGGTIDNNLCDFAVKLFCFAMDGGTTSDGGGEYESNNFATQIINLQSYGQATSVWLHGVTDVEVRGLQSLFGTSRDLAIGTIIGRGSQAVESSRRVNIHDSAFQRSWTQSPGNPATTIIDINEDCVGCIIAHNTFGNSYKYDISLAQQIPLINVDGLLIEGNQFKDSQQYNAGSNPGYPSIYLANVGNSGQITIANNHWENSGSYGVWSSQNVSLLGNTCHNPMRRSAPSGGSAAQNVCWYLADGAVNSVARDNVTDSTSYGAVGITTAGGHGATLDSSGNRSGWATCDVCVADATGGTVKSVNERALNSGSSGNAAFTASTSASPITVNSLTVNGDLSVKDIPGHEYFVSKYAGIQAAIDAAYNNGTVQGGATVIDDRLAPYSGAGFIVKDSVTVKLAATTYTITGTVTYNNGVGNVTAGIIAMPGSHIVGVGTSSNHGTIVSAGVGLSADMIASSTLGTGAGANAQWWHWGSIENLNINGGSQASGRCLVIENMGETARVENILARNCYGNNIEIIGSSASQSSIRNITTMRSQTASGMRFTNLSGVGKVDGLSGDCNPASLVSVQENAAGSLTILGLKAEGEASICTGQVHDPVVLLDGLAGFNDHVRIIGGYAFGTAQGSFAKFVNGGNAILEAEGLYITGYTNMLNDTVRGVTVPLSSNMSKQPFYYEPGGTTFANQAFTLTGGTFVQGQPATTPTEIFGLTTGSATLLAAAGNGDNGSVLTGGIQISGQNRTQYGTPPEIMARWGYRWLGAGLGYDTTNFDLVPAWNSADTSSRNLGNALSVCKKGSTTVSCRWPNIYALNVDTTALTLNGSAVTIPTAGSTTPLMNGAGAAGSSANYARADHVHPSDTSRAAANASTTVNGVTCPLGGSCALPGSPVAYSGTGSVTMTNSGATAYSGFPITAISAGAMTADASYMVTVEVAQTAPGVGICAGTVNFSMAFKDPDTSTTYALNTVFFSFLSLSNVTSPIGSLAMNTSARGAANTFTSIPRTLRMAAGTAVQFQFLQNAADGASCSTHPTFTWRVAIVGPLPY